MRSPAISLSAAAIRETIESVVIAFVLALLFRTFEAEAFVIPTGSMAPTLMGRHKDVVCPKCGCPYQVNAHMEVDDAGNLRDSSFQVVAGTCPMCRYTAATGSRQSATTELSLVQRRSHPGEQVCLRVGRSAAVGRDRVQVSGRRHDRRADQFHQAPGRACRARRCRIQHGDLWIRRGQEPFQIARKPPEKLLAMLQPVFDNDYMPRIAEYGWPARWQPEPTAERQHGRGVEFRRLRRRFTPTARPPARIGFATTTWFRTISSGERWRQQGSRPPETWRRN